MQFAKIIGQTRVINSFIKVAKDKRISHTQLFLGQANAGTFALALAYAQFINCINKQDFHIDSEDELIADSCGKCPSCLKYEQLAHPDLHLFFPNVKSEKLGVKENPESYLFLKQFREFVLKNEGYIDLDAWYQMLNVGNSQGLINVRDVERMINNLSLTACEADYKVTIVWCFDKLNSDAANKLLKILEEPDDKTLFFLITDNAQAILPTILSRCQLIKIPPINEDLKVHKKRTEDDEYFEQLLVRWLRAAFAVNKDISPLVELGGEFADLGRERQRLFLELVMNVLRKTMYVNVGISKSNDLYEITDEKFRAGFPKMITPDTCYQIYQLLEQATFHIQRNANPKILFCDLSIKTGNILRQINK
ncbi:MAG: DNA polymerase III subunit [Bacteroidales bacterium]|jgi:DNA polymerase-3 subunit delta'|nr:DNA polymerase III subunit [Bacteroidales bacterium]